MLAGQEDSFQIDFHLAIPVLFGQGYRTALGRTTNVVHQDVDTPKPLYAGGDHPGQGIVVGDIAGGGRDLGSRFLGSSNGFRHRILSHIHAKVRASSRPKIAQAARPLSQHGPTQPAPVMIATLPSSRPAMGYSFVLARKFRCLTHGEADGERVQRHWYHSVKAQQSNQLDHALLPKNNGGTGVSQLPDRAAVQPFCDAIEQSLLTIVHSLGVATRSDGIDHVRPKSALQRFALVHEPFVVRGPVTRHHQDHHLGQDRPKRRVIAQHFAQPLRVRAHFVRVDPRAEGSR